MNPITVLLADDHTMVREGLRKMLELDSQWKRSGAEGEWRRVHRPLQVVGEAQNGRQAVALARTLRPDVVLMDIAMPLLNGLEATRQVLKMLPATKVLILSAHCDDAYVTHAQESGAIGFLVKQTSANEVCEAVRRVCEGGDYYSPALLRRIERLNPGLNRAGLPEKANRLTSREMEVLQLIAEGKANKEIAGELAIGIKTVEKHRQHLMFKLDIHDIAGLTRYAISQGIIESSVQLTIL